MRVYPAIDLWGGEVCFLSPEPGFPPTRISADPVSTARRWAAAGARRIHLVDLNAALDRGDNRTVVREILEEVRVPVQVGGGVRQEERVAELFDQGAYRVIVSTRALRDPSWLRTVARRWPGRMILGLDRKGGETLIAGRSERAGALPGAGTEAAAGFPLGGVLVTDVETEGRQNGVGTVLKIPRAPADREWIAAGGVSRIDDLSTLRAAGYAAAVVGIAAYRDPERWIRIWEVLP
ncbi:MAG: 1-(5-phosphoribosyl)-5-[(5-phosphoribosylamino)methylideneamino]imidazole-4-carboxamide isomerase [Thermoplasmata archaeon]